MYFNNCGNSSINKTFIIEGGGGDIISGCTGIYTNFISSCSGNTSIQLGDTIVFSGDVSGIGGLTANTISSDTYYSGGTNLLDLINSSDTFVTGGTYNPSTINLDFSGNSGFAPFSVDVSALKDDTNTYVTGFTYDNLNTFTITDNLGTAFTSTINQVSGLTVNGGLSATTLSACTGIYTSNLYGCSPITLNDNLQHISSSATGINSIAFGTGTTASGDFSHAEGYDTIASGDFSHAEGKDTIASGWNGSHAAGQGFSDTTRIEAAGKTSFIHYNQTISATTGAYGDYSAILGGNNHNIGTGGTSSGIFAGSGNTINDDVLRSVVLGGYDITGITNDTVYVPNLSINVTPTNDDALTQILSRDSSDGTIKYRDVDSIISAATSADTYVTGFTYDDANTFTISDNSGSTFSSTINTVTGLTSTGDVEVIGNLTVTGGSGNVLSKQYYVEGNLGLDWDFTSSSITLGNVSDGTIINGTGLTINSDTTINGNLSATTISATTFYGDGSNLTGIPHTTDTFVSGGTYNDITDIITFTNTTGGTFGVSGVTDTFVTGFTWNPSTFDLAIEQNNGVTDETVNLSVLASDVYVSLQE